MTFRVKPESIQYLHSWNWHKRNLQILDFTHIYSETNPADLLLCECMWRKSLQIFQQNGKNGQGGDICEVTVQKYVQFLTAIGIPQGGFTALSQCTRWSAHVKARARLSTYTCGSWYQTCSKSGAALFTISKLAFPIMRTFHRDPRKHQYQSYTPSWFIMDMSNK